MKKLGGKSLKFSSSMGPYIKPPPAVSGDKQSKELLLTQVFAEMLHRDGAKITKVEVNEDDSHGRPDTLMTIDEKELGIQLTKISLNDPLRRINVSESQTNEILNFIPTGINIPKPLNVYIYLNSEDKNSIPSGKLKRKKKLAELIASKIEEQRINLFSEEPDLFGFVIDDPELKKMASSITITPVNSGQHSTFIGRNGIHINYEFDLHDWDESDLNKEIERIIEAKEGGTEDILLIWGDRFELLYQDKAIAEVLQEKFVDTQFKKVYFLAFFDRVDQFLDSWRLTKIK